MELSFTRLLANDSTYEESLVLWLPKNENVWWWMDWIQNNVPLPAGWFRLMDRKEEIAIQTDHGQVLCGWERKDGTIVMQWKVEAPDHPRTSMETMTEWVYQLQRSMVERRFPPIRMELQLGELVRSMGDWTNDEEWRWLAGFRSGRDQPTPPEVCVMAAGIRRRRSQTSTIDVLRTWVDVWTMVVDEEMMPEDVIAYEGDESLDVLRQGRLHHKRFPELYITFPPPIIIILQVDE